MAGFLARNLIQKLITLFLISILSFLIVHLAPGKVGPTGEFSSKMMSADVRDRFYKEYNLDKPLYVQYYLFYKKLFTGEAVSWKDNRPVLATIWERFLNSLWLFVIGTVITWMLAFPVGIHAAVHRGGFYDQSTTFLAYLLISIPGFFLAYVMIIFVVKYLHIPVIGMETFGMQGVGGMHQVMDRVWHMALPAVLEATAGIAILSRYVRGQMLEVEGQDYIRTARAKGLSEETVHYKHALRNALMPFVTMFGMILPGLIGGSVIIEQIFAWPGMGRLEYDAIVARNYPIVLSLTFVSAVLVLIGTFVSDLLYMFVDPRVKYD